MAAQHATRSSLHADLASGAFATPEAFESRCGRADEITRNSAGVILRYSQTLVHLGRPVTFQRLAGDPAHPVQIGADEAVALRDLHCGG
jgi:hypothetical protein